MRENELAAGDLMIELRTAGVEAQVTGSGVHWQVRSIPSAARGIVIHCFWYERALSGLVLGMNPSNARRQLARTRKPFEGNEYLVVLESDGKRVADGRTRTSAEAVSCARSWTEGASLEEVERVTPFIHCRRRAVLSLEKQIDPRLRREVASADPTYDLWVYGEGRSCQIEADDERVSCAFFLGQAQVAFAETLEDVSAAVAGWLLSGMSLQELAAHAKTIVIERHAEVLEVDPARWHWLHVRDRIANPHDVLAPLRELLEVLAGSSIATKFYSFSSLNSFCFSASSHYPWVNRGLPAIVPANDGSYLVDAERCNLAAAVTTVERALSEYPTLPFFGSAPQHEASLLAEAFAHQGSALLARAMQRGAWYDVVVGEGERRCVVRECEVTFRAPMDSKRLAYASLDDAARAIRRYLEDGVSLEELTTRERR